ncbi:1-acyl-sn-glycerol-3-phosphate acyltransferase [Branchiibius hedensis]|uniref:1-acyl-sn-glycerol-3-phosphate acyltransferases n=1 Tax=Branchiibius hedensis TaxID=672460 RepID=A0A2Y8ZUX9_9MICO|nr:lysophospholipid acyltransferase family protein [Branchiibius hedensis]PWJ26494.1 1-acyl-sn-glycerol-3-phosphate acyltransferase [Branchiibius hedensis]SSA35306.1 1-acyl-sn-glycerol-3-phosphate acyltransferases [Branchiibius hedensis]
MRLLPNQRIHLPSRLRRGLWRGACALAGGLTVSGQLPASPDGRGRILVANHSSHADTAALMAGLPPSGKPVFAAAADYWFDVWWRRALITGLAGGLPVRRHEHGAYAGLLAAAREAVDDGRTVVLYPEGTRSTDGSVAEFASGASRLAHDLNVPVVPVALLGTGDVLPKRGRFRPAPMQIRIGAAMHEPTPEQLRTRVSALLGLGPAETKTSRTWRAVHSLVESRWGLLLAGGWGFAEAISWPVMAEMSLVFFAAAEPSRIPKFSGALIAGSLTGVLVNTVAARNGRTFPAPWTTPRMWQTAARDLREEGPRGILHQALNGVPVKVYARTAGELRCSLVPFTGWVAVERGARLGAIAVGVYGASVFLNPWLRRLYGQYLTATGVGFTVVIRQIIRAWS